MGSKPTIRSSTRLSRRSLGWRPLYELDYRSASALEAAVRISAVRLVVRLRAREYSIEVGSLESADVTTLRVENSEEAVNIQVVFDWPAGWLPTYRTGAVPERINKRTVGFEFVCGVFTAYQAAFLRRDLGFAERGSGESSRCPSKIFRPSRPMQSFGGLLAAGEKAEIACVKICAPLLGQREHIVLELTRTQSIEYIDNKCGMHDALGKQKLAKCLRLASLRLTAMT